MMPLRRTDGPLFEYACHEGNIGMEGIMAGARGAWTRSPSRPIPFAESRWGPLPGGLSSDATVGSAALAPVAGGAAAEHCAVRATGLVRATTPLAYPDPDIIALDDRFRPYILFNTPIRRHYVGTLWAEGPAWNGSGRYLVWSDIPNNRQMRWHGGGWPRHRLPESVQPQ